MGREIKFRAWDKRTEQMFDHVDFLEEGRLMVRMASKLAQGEPDVENAKGGIMLHTDDENFEFMQFTGLHDTNGKEIYEGDVVKALKHNDEKFTNEITWRGGSLWFGNWNWIEFQNIFRNIEVIGNIHENPELLAK